MPGTNVGATNTTSAARRMSAEEAAAKADALIAQHRAGRAPARRASLVTPPGPGAAGARFSMLLLFVIGVATGLCWRSYPMVSLTLCAIAVPLAMRILRAMTDPSTGDARRR